MNCVLPALSLPPRLLREIRSNFGFYLSWGCRVIGLLIYCDASGEAKEMFGGGNGGHWLVKLR